MKIVHGFSRMIAVAIVLVSGLSATGSAQPRLTLPSGADVLRGEAPHVLIEGVTPADTFTIRAYRTSYAMRDSSGTSKVDTMVFSSWARLRADAKGNIDVGRARPIAGSWSTPDGLGMFWSMMRVRVNDTSKRMPVPPIGSIGVRLERSGVVLDSVLFRLRPTLISLNERTVANGTIAGAFAAPADGRRHPVVLLLHGSEGGDTTTAKIYARRMASRGFAAFAVVYVSYGGVLPGIPPTFDAVPVEMLDRVREWIGSQPESDTSRTGVWGASKGAEFAMVTAAFRSWPRAVVGCVPSDIVWAGFGRDTKLGEELTSWSVGGAPLRALQYDRYEDVFTKKASARQVHDRSREKNAAAVAGARIPIERTRASVLLLAADSDNVWASAPMSRAITNTLNRASKGRAVRAVTYPNASHDICGDGTSPYELFPEEIYDRRATAAATADAWQSTVKFLTTALLPARTLGHKPH